MLLDRNPYGSEPVNIGFGRDVTIKQLAEIIAQKSGFQGEIIWDTTKPDGMMRKLMDTTRARVIGFVPEIGIEKGVELLISEYTLRSNA